ncbi:MAG: FAD-binding oxidoreductase [Hyphomicrobium sp.]
MIPTEGADRDRPAARWQSARIIDVVQRTPHIKSFFFSLPVPFQFRAGQHVDVRLTAPDGYRAMRSYSIASAPAATPSSTVELAIDLLESGEVSPFFHEVAAVGDEIEMRGPLGGHFVWSPDDGGPLLLLGGGSGLVPLMSMVRTGQAGLAPPPTALLLSARTWEDTLYRDELIEFERRQNDFTVNFALTRDAPQRPQDYGRRVDAPMLRDVIARLPSSPKHVFVCGANAFVGAAADAALAAGVSRNAIRTERYGG